MATLAISRWQEREANTRPFPNGTVIVKEFTRIDTNCPGRVRQLAACWDQAERSRNFENRPFVHLFASQDGCIGCHKETGDWGSLFDALRDHAVAPDADATTRVD